VTVLQDEVASAGDKPDKDVDYANLGGRANDILRLAQEQARELVQNATVEAEKLKEQARREADGLRNHAAREGDAIKSGGTAQLINYAQSCAKRSRPRSKKPRLKATP
jgi:vacuolar-type H+-ATPase subunit E/Vma4